MKRKTIYFSIILSAALAFNLLLPAQTPRASAAVNSWQKGATIFPRWNTDYSSASFQQSVRNLQGTGANFVTLHIPIHQSNIYSTDVYVGGDAPTDQSLADGINFIHSLGMGVAIKLQDLPNDGNWSAYINPGDRAAWFQNYGNILAHYAQIAQTNHVEEMVIGTELIDMTSDNINGTNTSNWFGLISRIRGIYSGKLTYSANWGGDDFTNEKSHIMFWSALDQIGIAAYYNLYDDNSVGNLTAQWNNWNTTDITPLANKWGKPVLFTEVGYKTLSDASQHPWMWWEGGSPDQQAQANDYQALLSYWNNYPFMQGGYLWNWSSDPNAGGSGDIDYTPQNKLAQTVITNWFKSAPAPSPTPSPSPSPSPFPSLSPSPSPTPSPTPPPPSSTVIDIWWPTDGSTISGTQPFKALLENTPLSSYTMYWQVDNGQLNFMADNQTDWPHKEALVDVSGWHWGGNGGTGPYNINIVAKDLNGNIVAQHQVKITVVHY